LGTLYLTVNIQKLYVFTSANRFAAYNLLTVLEYYLGYSFVNKMNAFTISVSIFPD